MARVLVADDDALTRAVTRRALASGGHEVIGEGETGVEAVRLFRQLRPELTTLDITLPVKDGLAALEEIMAVDATARVVMCSALCQQRIIRDAIARGARGFVVKPPWRERLLDVLGAALG
jgi:two-component system, chemotaxis family, chemotaxis protein CheY